MRKKFYLLFALLVVASMMLAACGPQTAEAPAADEQAVEESVEVEAEVEEPTEADADVDEPSAEDVAPPNLDAAFGSVLANMSAYNTIKADALLEEMITDAPPFLLDVRTTGEVEENGHIEGAVNVPLEAVAMNLNLLPDFDTPVVAYCGSGWRATIAMTVLNSLGWNDVRALKATFSDWKEAGNPVVDGPALDPVVLDSVTPDAGLVDTVNAMLSVYGLKPFGVITAEDLNVALVENPDLQVIDVRRAEEVDEKGFIEALHWTHIPLEDFVAKQNMWPATDSAVVIYCGSGHRSTMALAILGTYGYNDVRSLKGGFGGWASAGFPVVGGMGAEAATSESNFQTMLETMAGYNTIKADALMAEMAEDQPPYLLDVRTTAEVEEKGHITGATHIQLAEIAQFTNLLPGFDTPIVAYCGSGWRATVAMTMLKGMGYEDVRALKTTFSDWVTAGNPVSEGLPANLDLAEVEIDADILAEIDAALATYGVKPYGVITADDLNLALVDSPDLQVIDVRRDEEVEEKGTIEATNWTHIALEEFVAQKDKWPTQDSTVVVYCGSGHRSTMALAILGAYGYGDVSSLKGGFGGWLDAGYAVVGGKAAADDTDFVAVLNDMLANMEGYNTVKADGLLVDMIEDQPPFLLDVRTTGEVEENGHIEGAFHMPLAELAQHVDLLPDFDTPIVTYCGSGWRATIAMTTLYAMGYTDVRALKTTFADWVDAGNPVVEGLPESMALNAVEIPSEVLTAVDASMAVYGVKPYAGITADDFNLALLEEEIIVVDVRRLEELEEKGVVDVGEAEYFALPIEQFVAEMAQWPADKDAKIVVYCGSGHRSTMVAAILGLYGYNNVWSLKGGFGGWVEAGYPIAEFVAP